MKPRCGAFDGSFAVLGYAAVASHPCEGAFDDPAPGQDLEALGAVATLDNLDCPLAELGQRRAKLVASIASVREDMAQPGEAVADAGQHIGRAITVLLIGGVDNGSDEEALRVGDGWRFLPLIL